MLLTPCLDCGELSHSAYCSDHRPVSAPKSQSTTERGYGWNWQKLSKRARRIQPFCSDCGSIEDLQLDHTSETWERYYSGKVIKLEHTGGVVCGDCNIKRGKSRPGDHTPTDSTPAPRREANSLTNSTLNEFGGGGSV